MAPIMTLRRMKRELGVNQLAIKADISENENNANYEFAGKTKERVSESLCFCWE